MTNKMNIAGHLEFFGNHKKVQFLYDMFVYSFQFVKKLSYAIPSYNTFQIKVSLVVIRSKSSFDNLTNVVEMCVYLQV